MMQCFFVQCNVFLAFDMLFFAVLFMIEFAFIYNNIFSFIFSISSSSSILNLKWFHERSDKKKSEKNNKTYYSHHFYQCKIVIVDSVDILVATLLICAKRTCAGKCFDQCFFCYYFFRFQLYISNWIRKERQWKRKWTRKMKTTNYNRTKITFEIVYSHFQIGIYICNAFNKRSSRWIKWMSELLYVLLHALCAFFFFFFNWNWV